jgi:hypothetical protein
VCSAVDFVRKKSSNDFSDVIIGPFKGGPT